jgi:hypothetical protein
MIGVTIYRNPLDFPGKFVARAWRTTRRRLLTYARPLAVVGTLAEARWAVRMRFPGLVNVGREPGDDPVIVESHL